MLKIQAENTSLLLTGDIESPVEFRLEALYGEKIKSDVLLMPHHGSKTSSTESFIKTVNPKHVINSSGRYNPFNHPADVILDRYQDLDITVLDTQQAGLITMDTYPTLQFLQTRTDSPHIWRKKKPE